MTDEEYYEMFYEVEALEDDLYKLLRDVDSYDYEKEYELREEIAHLKTQMRDYESESIYG